MLEAGKLGGGDEAKVNEPEARDVIDLTGLKPYKIEGSIAKMLQYRQERVSWVKWVASFSDLETNSQSHICSKFHVMGRACGA